MSPSNVSSTRCCRMCGCTDDRACYGGCAWAEDDLCTSYLEPLEWPCLWPPCEFTALDEDVMRAHEYAQHPELMAVLHELLEEHAREAGLIR